MIFGFKSRQKREEEAQRQAQEEKQKRIQEVQTWLEAVYEGVQKKLAESSERAKAVLTQNEIEGLRAAYKNVFNTAAKKTNDRTYQTGFSFSRSPGVQDLSSEDLSVLAPQIKALQDLALEYNVSLSFYGFSKLPTNGGYAYKGGYGFSQGGNVAVSFSLEDQYLLEEHLDFDLRAAVKSNGNNNDNQHLRSRRNSAVFKALK